MVYVGFEDLEKTYDRVNREPPWSSLKMYDVGGKLSKGIKTMYVSSLACVRVKLCERECIEIDSGLRQSWLLKVYMDAVMKEVKTLKGRMKVRFLEEGR